MKDITDVMIKGIKENYNSLSGVYSLIGSEIDRRRISAEKILLEKYAPKHGLVLDAGVGYGASGAEAAKRGLIVHGLDVDVWGLQASTIYIHHLLRMPYLAYLGDLQKCHIPEWFYEMVLCTETLEHIPDEAQVIEKLYNALRTDGILLASVPLNDDVDPSPPRPIKTPWGNFELHGHIRTYTDTAHFTKKIARVGFEILNTTTVSGAGRTGNKFYVSAIVVARKTAK